MQLKFATIVLASFPIQLSEEQFDLRYVHSNLNQTVTTVKHGPVIICNAEIAREPNRTICFC